MTLLLVYIRLAVYTLQNVAKALLKIHLDLSFDKFLLAVESRDLSQADKSIL